MNPEEVLLAQIAACGLNPDGIAIRYEADLQSEVISLGPTSGLADEHFECLWNSTRGSFLEIADTELAAKYRAFADDKARVWMLGEATRWLKAHNKLDGVPVYAPGGDLKTWAESVETFCEMKPGEALKVLSATQLTMQPVSVEAVTDPRRECLFHVLMLSDLEGDGIEFGFIGYEYNAESSP